MFSLARTYFAGCLMHAMPALPPVGTPPAVTHFLVSQCWYCSPDRPPVTAVGVLYGGRDALIDTQTFLARSF